MSSRVYSMFMAHVQQKKKSMAISFPVHTFVLHLSVWLFRNPWVTSQGLHPFLMLVPPIQQSVPLTQVSCMETVSSQDRQCPQASCVFTSLVSMFDIEATREKSPSFTAFQTFNKRCRSPLCLLFLSSISDNSFTVVCFPLPCCLNCESAELFQL